MQFNEIWRPQEKQRLALQSPAYELFYGGARGGGKSDFLIGDFTKGIHFGSAWRGIIFRRNFPELEEVITRTKELYPRIGGEYKETKRTWTFPSGATLKMRFLESPDDVHNYQGHQYTWMGFDELTAWPTSYEYLYMMGVVRSATGVPSFVRSSGNPGSRGHAWVKARFIDPMPPYEMFTDPDSGLSRVFIPSFLDDNTLLMRNDPSYENRLRLMGEKLYRAHRWGEWDVVQGGAFDEFERTIHVEDPFPIPRSWYRFMAMDWGYAKPYAIGFYAVSPDGAVVRYNEMYGGDAGRPNVGMQKSAQKVAREAMSVASREGIEEIVCDPSMWASHGHTRSNGEPTSIASDFKRVGFKLYKARNDRIGGKAQLHKMLQSRRPDGKGLFTVTSNCKHFLRTFPVLTLDPHNPEDVDTTVEDHIYDETRYALNSRLIHRKPRGEPVAAVKEEYDVLNW